MKKGNGIITEEDLKNYKAKNRDPIVFDYKGNTVVYNAFAQQRRHHTGANAKDGRNEKLGDMKFGTAQSVQLMTEIERRAFADRAKFLGDPDFVKVPVKTLVSDEYLKKRMSDYDPGKAGNSKDIKEGNIQRK